MATAAARGLRADAAIAATVLVLGSFLWVMGLGLLERWQQSTARHQGAGVDDLLGAVAVATGMAIVAWWILSAILAAAEAVLARCGRKHAAAGAGRFCPAFMRRLAVAAFSVQLLSAPLAGAAGFPAGPDWVPTRQVSVEAPWVPTSASAQTPNACSAPAPLPGPQDPAAQETLPGNSAPRAVSPQWRPNPPTTDPDLLAAQPIRAAPRMPASPAEVTVLAGDTLWDIASRRLGSTASDVEVALHWPRWYEANKARIGDNPDVLLPGQILKAPSTA